MRNRMDQITRLAILAGVAALAGCASVRTPKEYADSHGYRPIEIQGKEYFCRREQPEVPGSPLTGVSCLTRAQLSAMVARFNDAPFGSAAARPGTSQFGFETQGLGMTQGNELVNGQGLGR